MASVGLILEWDPAKAVANIVKHGLSFSEAATAFFDPLAHIFPDERHSVLESREILVGYSEKGTLLVVSFLQMDDNRVRLVSARPATRREKKRHEEAQPN